MDEQNELQKIWAIPGPWLIAPSPQGAHNQTQVIDTPSGNYILRRYPVERPSQHIRYELSVLRSLELVKLPFQIPTPLPTVDGEDYAVTSDNIVTLSPYLPGQTPKNDNLQHTSAAGQALAELVVTQENVSIDTAPEILPFPPFGDFQAWLGQDNDFLKIIQQLPLTKENRQQLLSLKEEMEAAIPLLYQTLPQQVVHRDYDPSNVLITDNRVSAVLDFEFCGYDLRAADFAFALSQWLNELWYTGKEWAVVDAFGRAYTNRQRLISIELEALPVLFQLRAYTTLLLRLNRYAQELITEAAILHRIQSTLLIRNWVHTYK